MRMRSFQFFYCRYLKGLIYENNANCMYELLFKNEDAYVIYEIGFLSMGFSTIVLI